MAKFIFTTTTSGNEKPIEIVREIKIKSNGTKHTQGSQ